MLVIGINYIQWNNEKSTKKNVYIFKIKKYVMQMNIQTYKSWLGTFSIFVFNYYKKYCRSVYPKLLFFVYNHKCLVYSSLHFSPACYYYDCVNNESPDNYSFRISFQSWLFTFQPDNTPIDSTFVYFIN